MLELLQHQASSTMANVNQNDQVDDILVDIHSLFPEEKVNTVRLRLAIEQREKNKSMKKETFDEIIVDVKSLFLSHEERIVAVRNRLGRELMEKNKRRKKKTVGGEDRERSRRLAAVNKNEAIKHEYISACKG